MKSIFRRKRRAVAFCGFILSLCMIIATVAEELDDELGAHPDPNDEDHPGMIFIGRHEGETEEDKRRVGFEHDNGIKYIFGTGFDETHKEIEEKDLHHHSTNALHDLADRGHDTKTREEVLKER